LSVDAQTRTSNGATTSVDTVTVVTDAGEMRTVALEPGVSVRILDRGLSEDVSKYLSVVASARERDVRRLSIAASGTGDRDLFVSYVSEVPVWKATYRLVVPDAGDARKPLLQGWAIVDNTVGEDWTNVQMSLVAGAPQAFIQAISRPYYVGRPVVPMPQRFSLTPQTHGSAVTTGGGGGAGGGGRGAPAAPPASLPNNQFNITIDGATSSTLLKNNDGMFSMVTPRLDAIEEVALRASVKQALLRQTSDADAAALGDLFEYKMKEPITLRLGTIGARADPRQRDHGRKSIALESADGFPSGDAVVLDYQQHRTDARWRQFLGRRRAGLRGRGAYGFHQGGRAAIALLRR
jgi:hypothetical protein